MNHSELLSSHLGLSHLCLGHHVTGWKEITKMKALVLLKTFLGFLSDHACYNHHWTCLQVETGSVMSQYLVVYDFLFTTVPTSIMGELEPLFHSKQWQQVIVTVLERYIMMKLMKTESLSKSWIYLMTGCQLLRRKCGLRGSRRILIEVLAGHKGNYQLRLQQQVM